MGINGLWPALDQASKPVTAEDLRGKVLAVDLSIWLVEACTSRLLRTEHKHPQPMARRAFRWRRPSVDALAFANAERCVHGFHARPSLRYVLARVARLVD